MDSSNPVTGSNNITDSRRPSRSLFTAKLGNPIQPSNLITGKRRNSLITDSSPLITDNRSTSSHNITWYSPTIGTEAHAVALRPGGRQAVKKPVQFRLKVCGQVFPRPVEHFMHFRAAGVSLPLWIIAWIASANTL
jgi:hypothetical protein